MYRSRSIVLIVVKKRILIAVILAIILGFARLNAQPRVGLGIIIGEPTGVSFKNWFSTYTAVAGALAWSTVDERLHFHLDYLKHRYISVATAPDIRGEFALYYGGGIRIVFKDTSEFGVRGPVGIDYVSRALPIDIFVEIVPVFNFAPETEVKLSGGFGARYYF